MMLLVAVTCWIGIATAHAAGVGEEEDEIAVAVAEGGNLTISCHFEKLDKDSQVFFFRLRLDSTLEPIAQLFCNNGDCRQKYWKSGVSLILDGGNVSLILIHVSYNQTGLYEIRKHSKWRENKIYNVTVYQPALTTILTEKSASATYSEFTAGICTVLVVAVLSVLSSVIIGAVIYRKHKGKSPPKVIDGSNEARSWHRAQSGNASYL